MNQLKNIFFLLWTALFLFSNQSVLFAEKVFRAEKGVIDLKEWNPQKNSSVYLNGEWEFYWDKLYGPEDFHDSFEESLQPDYQTIPSRWNPDYPSFGKATYRLKIITSEEVPLSIYISEILCFYKIWINGEPALNMLPVSMKNNRRLYLFPQIHDFKDTSRHYEIIIQVFNDVHQDSGIWKKIKIGTRNSIHYEYMNKLLINGLLVGALIIIGLYYLILFVFRKKELSSLYFAVICFLIFFRVILNGEKIVFLMFPGLGQFFALRLAFISFFILTPVFTAYIQSLFKEQISIRLVQTAWIFATVYIMTTFFIPISVISGKYFMLFYQIFTAATGFFLIFKIFRSFLSGNKDALFFLLGFVVVLITGINDMLYYGHFIHTMSLLPFGLFAFIFVQSIILSRKYMNYITIVEDQANSLIIYQITNNRQIENIKKTIQILTNTVNKIKDNSEQTSVTSAGQVSSVNNIVSTMENTEEISKKMVTQVSEVLKISNQTRTYVDAGTEIITQNINQMKELKSQNERTLEGIQILSNKIQNIWEIIQMIRSISDQTKVIAFNAQLEAASAGRGGKNFQIVANEIRRLADHTMESIRNIKEQINEIQHYSDRLTFISEEESESIQNEWKLLNRLSEIFNDINDSSEISATSAEGVTNSIQQQAGSFTHILDTLKKVSSGTNEFVKQAESGEKLTVELIELTEQLKKLIKKNESYHLDDDNDMLF